MITREDQSTEIGWVIFVTNIQIFLIGNSLNEEEFKEFINHAIQEREKLIIEKKSLEMQVDSRIAKAIEHSSMLSS